VATHQMTRLSLIFSYELFSRFIGWLLSHPIKFIPMTSQEIISQFQLYVDDSSELSTSEALSLLNKIYHKVCDEKVWEFLKTEATGTVSGSTITLPDNFAHLTENYNYTDNSYSRQLNARPIVVFIGSTPYQVINWSDRKQYENNNSICFVDIAHNVLRFAVAQSGVYSFDYKSFPDDLEIDDEPVFPARFHPMLAHGMAVDDMIIQLFPKAQSYAQENQANYQSYLNRMALWNANLNLD
jgi:hypothetical protein